MGVGCWHSGMMGSPVSSTGKGPHVSMMRRDKQGPVGGRKRTRGVGVEGGGCVEGGGDTREGLTVWGCHVTLC